MLRSFVVLTACSIAYLALPMKPVTTPELQKVYDHWKGLAEQDNVVRLRALAFSPRANADKWRKTITALTFAATQKQVGYSGDLGEWSEYQIADVYGGEASDELFELPELGISRVYDYTEGAGIFFLVVKKKTRTLPPFEEVRGEIEMRQNAYRASHRWTSWLPHDRNLSIDQRNWYLSFVAKRH